MVEVSPRLWCFSCARDIHGGPVAAGGEVFCSIECARHALGSQGLDQLREIFRDSHLPAEIKDLDRPGSA